MNQILFTGDKNNSLEIRKIIKFFCVVIIFFAILLTILGGYLFFKHKRNIDIAKKVEIPTITIETQNGMAKVNIKNEITLKNVFYSWKNGQESEFVNAKGKKELSEEIFLPNEDTILNLRMIDMNDQEFKYSQEFKYIETKDNAKPRITLASNTTGKIDISVTDNKEIADVQYKWNDSEPIKIEIGEDQKTNLTYQIDALEGKNKLIVIAKDSSENEAQAEKEIVTVTKPTINLKKSKGEIIIRVSDEEEVTKVEYEINGTKYVKENTGDNKKEFEIRDLLVKGENLIKVIAYNKAGLTAEKVGKCTY